MSARLKNNSRNNANNKFTDETVAEIAFESLKIATWILLGIVVVSVLMVIFTPSFHKKWKAICRTASQNQNENFAINASAPSAQMSTSNKIVNDSDLSEHAPRFSMLYENWCGYCKKTKPLVIDYAENKSPDGFKIILRDCADRANLNECSKTKTVPRFLFQKNAQDEGEFFPGSFNVDQFDVWVKEKLSSNMSRNGNNDNDNLYDTASYPSAMPFDQNFMNETISRYYD